MTNKEAQQFNDSMARVKSAQDELLKKLFGSVPDNPGEHVVTREAYTKAMKDVQAEFGLVEGDPDLVLFVLEQLSRSPRFENDNEGAEDNGRAETGTTSMG